MVPSAQCLSGAMQQRSNANPSGGSPVPDILAAWRMHVQGLARLAMAENLSHIDSSKAMLMGPEDKLPFIRIAASGPTVNHRYLEEAVKAAMNCMRLIMQKKDSFLFLSCSSAGLLTSVWGDITHFLLCFYDNRSQGLANGTSARLFAALTGLIPALTSYSQAFILAVNQLTSDQEQTQRMQQLESTDKPFATAWALCQGLLRLWSRLCRNLADVSDLCGAFIRAAPAVAGLAAQAVPQLFKASEKASSSSAVHDWLQHTAYETARAAGGAGAYYAYTSCQLQQPQQTAEVQEQPRRDAEHLLLTDHLAELLLLTLADLAQSLSATASQPPSAPGYSAVAGFRPCSTDQLLQQQAGVCGERHTIFSSHVALLHTVATGACCRGSATCKANNSGFAGAAGAGDKSAQAASSSDRLGLISIFWVVRSLQFVILQHIEALLLLTFERNSTTTTSSSSDKQQQQQHSEAIQAGAFPNHLVNPTIKVLLNLAVLTPPADVRVRTACLEVVLLLLHISTQGATVAPLPAAGSLQGQVGEAADFSDTTPSARAADTYGWPVLPAAVAGGLLHPVVQLLSRAVIGALNNVLCMPQQQQTDEEEDYVTSSQHDDRMLLLHRYGNLLIMICLSVEPRHIAAALRSDPVIPLVAIEAVTRAAACHLGVSDNSRQQQQQLDVPAAETGNGLPVNKPQLSDNSRGEAATLLLPFVSKITHALQHLVQNKQLLQLSDKQMNFGAELPSRLCSLATTALKVVQVAAAWLSEHQKAVATAPSAAACSSSAETWASGASRMVNTSLTWRKQVKEWLAAVTSGAAAVPPPAWSDGPPLNSKEWLLVQVPISVMQLAIGWDSILKAGSCYSIDQSILPVSLLLQAAGVYAAALDPFHRRTTQHALHDACSFPLAQQHIGSAEVSSMVAAAVSHMLTDVLNVLQSTCDTLHGVSLWSTLVNAAAGNGAAGSNQHSRYSQRPWLHQHIASSRNLVMRMMHLKCTAEIHKYSCMGAVAACTDATEVKFTIPTNGSVTPGGSIQMEYVATCEDPSWNEQVRTFFPYLHDSATAAAASFPIPFCCNNPSCINLSKLSEYQLVSGEACVCGGCKLSRYCSRECQKKHWKQHQEVCCLLSQ